MAAFAPPERSYMSQRFQLHNLWIALHYFMMAMTRHFMSVAESIWLDSKIREGAGVKDGPARRVWNESVVDEFMAMFRRRENVGIIEDRRMTTRRVKKYINNHRKRVLGIPISPRHRTSRRVVKIPTSAASSPSSSSTAGKRARSFRDYIGSSDPLVRAKIKNLGALEKVGAITKGLSMILRAKFIDWRMECEDVRRMQLEWEGGELVISQSSPADSDSSGGSGIQTTPMTPLTSTRSFGPHFSVMDVRAYQSTDLVAPYAALADTTGSDAEGDMSWLEDHSRSAFNPTTTFSSPLGTESGTVPVQLATDGDSSSVDPLKGLSVAPNVLATTTMEDMSSLEYLSQFLNDSFILDGPMPSNSTFVPSATHDAPTLAQFLDHSYGYDDAYQVPSGTEHPLNPEVYFAECGHIAGLGYCLHCGML